MGFNLMFRGIGLALLLASPFFGAESDALAISQNIQARHVPYGAVLDPVLAADKILEHIERKRDALRINVKKERKLFDMKSRRELQ